MIQVEKFILNNGLTVLFHPDPTTPLAVVNTLYKVGAKNEDPNRTGFAHLFEHLMFGGSKHIADFDKPLQNAGGQSNAFTSNDLTNYYNVLPKENIDTALWLESDRMLSLAFTPKSLEVQRQVVIEEFRQRYLNQPYGDVWLELRPMAYEVHPYQWATIGKNIEQIETATLQEVKDFFHDYYTPENAILCIAGNFSLETIKEKVTHWFGDTSKRKTKKPQYAQEPEQTAFRSKTIVRDVPNDAFYYAFKMPGKMEDGFPVADLISDILGRGKSSRLYQTLLKDLQLVSEISAYVLGSHDEGLLIISGQVRESSALENIDTAIWQLIQDFEKNPITMDELVKTKNKYKTTKVFSDVSALSKAMLLCEYEMLGDANLANEEIARYDNVSLNDVQNMLPRLLQKAKCSRLWIKAQKD
ncbi:MAG: insulinase family protein [Crocinitomicaceae bacterium]|nr:insulinase family protein [Crocinitomicaceae bacterium]